MKSWAVTTKGPSRLASNWKGIGGGKLRLTAAPDNHNNHGAEQVVIRKICIGPDSKASQPQVCHNCHPRPPRIPFCPELRNSRPRRICQAMIPVWRGGWL